MADQLTPISVQLYSLREESTRDFTAVLLRLGTIGYVGVELAGLHGLSPAQFNTVIDEAGLVVSSGHLGDVSPDALNQTLDDLQAVGTNTAVLAFLPPDRFADTDAVKRSAELINGANEIARARGVTFGYHNHFWEFQASFDGRTAWSVLFDHLDPTVFAELDVYWARLGGADPVQVMGELGERLGLVHVKDGPADEPLNPMVAVGSGTMDVPGVLAAAGEAAWHIVELDRCATDMFDAVEASYRYLTTNGLSRGRV